MGFGAKHLACLVAGAGLLIACPATGADEKKQNGNDQREESGPVVISMDEADAAKPPLNLLDLHGYLRLRGDLYQGLGLGLEDLPASYPVAEDRGTAYPQFPGSATGRGDTQGMANLRFRLEPTINISEDVRVHAQLDLLDNLILGATPDGFPQNQYYPLTAFSQGQIAPSAGFNAVTDSIRLKRVWGEVLTPVGTLRFGRMGFHWGLGMLVNDGGPAFADRGPLVQNSGWQPEPGRCFDCDFGTTVDRIMFTTRIFEHDISVASDFASEGPTTHRFGYQGQPLDADQLDDSTAWALMVTHEERPRAVRSALARGGWVLEYGLFFQFKNQPLDATSVGYPQDEDARQDLAADLVWYPADLAYDSDLEITDFTARNAEFYTTDAWLRFMWDRLRLELELALVYGTVGDVATRPTYDENGDLLQEQKAGSVEMLQFGGVLRADYGMLDEELRLGLELGLATGDDAPGFGVRGLSAPQASRAFGDGSIDNFQFHRAYQVDMILFRRILGTVTDAVYLRPSVRYDLLDGLGAQLSMVYASAVYQASTRGKSHPLGLELDLDLFWFFMDKLHAGLSYGILFPLSGLDHLGDDMARGGTGTAADTGADIAHRILFRLVFAF